MIRTLPGNRAVIAAAFAILAINPFVSNLYMIYIGNLMLIYIILSLGLNLLIGTAGQFALAHVGMFGIGAYAAGLLYADFEVPFLIAALVGAAAASAIGTLLALPALRLSGMYLALATLAFAQATAWVFANWDAVTHGAGGFSLAPVSFSPLPVGSEVGMYFLSWVVCVVFFVFAWNLQRSRLGRAMIAMRDNDVAAQALGINLLRHKSLVFALSGFYAGAAGALYAGVVNFVTPDSFGLFQLIMIKAMIVVGGLGSVTGSLFGAIILIVFMEGTREFQSVQEIAFGLMLLVFIIFLPRGLAGSLARVLPGWSEPKHLVGKTDAGRAGPALSVRDAR